MKNGMGVYKTKQKRKRKTFKKKEEEKKHVCFFLNIEVLLPDFAWRVCRKF